MGKSNNYKYLFISGLLLIFILFFTFPSLALIPGDFNGDGFVEFEDLMLLAMAYGSTPDDDNWNAACDIAGAGGVQEPDGVVDFEDLMIFAMHYGDEEEIVFDHAMSFVDQFGSSIEYFVSLQWFGIPDATNYHVFRSLGPDSGFSEISGELVYDDDNQVTFDDHNGVEHGVTYYYYVEADLPADETITSSTITIDTWFPAFDLYYPGYEEVITEPNPTFTWENPGITIPYDPSVDLNGGVHFYVWDETIGVDMWEIEIDLTMDSIVYGGEPLQEGHQYIWGIRYEGDNSEGLEVANTRSEGRFYYGNVVPIEFITAITTPQDHQIELVWQAYPEATGYHIYKSVNGGTFSEINVHYREGDDNNLLVFIDNDILNTNYYQYYVTADTPAGETDPNYSETIDTWLPVCSHNSPGDQTPVISPEPTFIWNAVGLDHSGLPYGPIYEVDSHLRVIDLNEGNEIVWEAHFDECTTSTITYNEDGEGIPLEVGHIYQWIVFCGGYTEEGDYIAESYTGRREFIYTAGESAIISEVNAFTQVENDAAQIKQTLDYIVKSELIEPFYQLNQEEVSRNKGVAKGMEIYWTAYLQDSNCGYKIYKNINSTNVDDFEVVFSQQAPSGYDWYGWWDEDVTEGNTYSYYVTAYGDGWETPPSEIVTRSLWLPMTYLESPEHEATITEPEINFSWIPVGNQEEFDFPHTILRIFDPNASDPTDPVFTVAFDDLTSSSYLFTDTFLLDNQIYEWNVISHGCDEEGDLAAVSVAGNWGFNYRKMEGDVIISETTTITDDQTETQLTYVSSDQSSITFSQSTPQLEGLQENDILFIGVTPETPYGLLRKVTQIDRGDRADAPVNLSTEFATLEEAVEELHISENFVFTPADIDYDRLDLPKGVTLRPSRAGFEETFIWDLNEATGLIGIEGVTVNGELQIDYEMIFNLDLTPFTKYVELRNIVESHTDIEVTVGTTIPLEKDITLFTIPLVTIPIIPPVVITPFIHVNLGIDGQLEASVTAGLTIDQTGVNCLETGFVYDNGNFYEVENSPNFVFNPDSPQLDLSGNLKPYAGPQLEVLLTGCSIAYGNLYGNLELTADINADPWWSLYGGFEGIVGAHLEILSWDLLDPIEWTVYNYSELILDAGGPFISPIESPITSNLSAINVNQTSATIRGSIDDDGGEAAETLKWDVRVIDSGTATLIDTGTFPVGTYSKDLNDLEPGQTYEFQFNAENAAGLSNNSSWEEFTTPAPAATDPTVVTESPSNITQTSARLYGNITDTGGENCDRRGFVIVDMTSGTNLPLLYEDGSFSSGTYYLTLTGLTAGHEYRFSAYAENSHGVGTGDWVYFYTDSEKLLDYITVNPSSKTLVWPDQLQGGVDYYVTAHYTDGTSSSISTLDCTIWSDNDEALYISQDIITVICKYENSANVNIGYTEDSITRFTSMNISIDQYPGSICAKIVDGSGNLVSGEVFGYVLFKWDGSSWIDVKEVGGQESIYVFTSLSAGTYKVDFYDYATPLGTIENIYLSSSTDTEVATLVQ